MLSLLKTLSTIPSQFPTRGRGIDDFGIESIYRDAFFPFPLLFFLLRKKVFVSSVLDLIDCQWSLVDLLVSSIQLCPSVRSSVLKSPMYCKKKPPNVILCIDVLIACRNENNLESIYVLLSIYRTSKKTRTNTIIYPLCKKNSATFSSLFPLFQTLFFAG